MSDQIITDSRYQITVVEENVLVVKITDIAVQTGGGGGGTGTVQSVNNIQPDEAGNIALPLDFEPAGAVAAITPASIGAATEAQGLLAVTALQPGDQAAVGTISTFYLDASTAIADNQRLATAPSSYPQEADSAAVVSSINGGIGFLERFVSGPLGATSIPAGTWSLHNYCYASNLTGNNKIITRINRRCEQVDMTGTFTGAGLTRTFTVTGGAPFVAGDANASILLASLIETPTQTAWISGFTSSSVVTVTLTDAGFVNTTNVPLSAIYYLIFNTQASAPDITSSSLTVPMHADIEVVTATPTAVDPTDRIVAAYFAFTDQVASRTISLLHGGSANYSRIDTPLLGNLITQTIGTSTTTAPSENAVKEALALKVIAGAYTPNFVMGPSLNGDGILPVSVAVQTEIDRLIALGISAEMILWIPKEVPVSSGLLTIPSFNTGMALTPPTLTVSTTTGLLTVPSFGAGMVLTAPRLLTSYSDNFNRANGVLTSPWTAINTLTSLNIVSNQIAKSTVGDDWMYYNVALGQDHFAQLDYVDWANGGVNLVSVSCRMGGATLSGYEAWLSDTGTTYELRLYRRTATTGYLIAPIIVSASVVGIRLEVRGQELKAFTKTGTVWTDAVTVTDPGTVITGGFTGVRLNCGVSTYRAIADNFTCGPL